jgi:hypothetical protein
MNKIIWHKIPSVIRENKFFYNTGEEGAKPVTVMQSRYSGLWEIFTRDGRNGKFKTAKQAMKEAEKFL